MLAISYGELTEPVQLAARVLAFLAPAPIPSELFDVICEPDVRGKVRAALVGHSIITPLPTRRDDGPRLLGIMHRVLGAFLRSMSKEPAAELTMALEALGQILARQENDESAGWPLFSSLLPHARATLGCSRRAGMIPSESTRAATSPSRTTTRIPSPLGRSSFAVPNNE
ncbi:MAG TPA: hypothetical protein VKE51_42140 [Vicinamibacterales bacterium]|nr:hypothetical protein [Vicinamibacterales bacterium]